MMIRDITFPFVLMLSLSGSLPANKSESIYLPHARPGCGELNSTQRSAVDPAPRNTRGERDRL